MDAQKARRGLAIYFAVLLPLSAAAEWAIIRGGESIGRSPWLVYALMWSPALASVVARLALREGFGDVSFRPGRSGRAYLLAWLYPVAIGAVAYGIAWATGLATFGLPPKEGAEMAPALRFAAGLGVNLTLVTLISGLTAAGEEIGWRGFMLTRLVDARIPRPVLAGGIIWGAWHAPLILSGVYAAGGRPLLSTGLFLVDAVAFSYVIARLRLESGSVWPAVLLHASWNAVIQQVFDRATVGTPVWVGESGVLVVGANVLAALVICRRSWRYRRSPAGQAPEESLAPAAL